MWRFIKVFWGLWTNIWQRSFTVLMLVFHTLCLKWCWWILNHQIHGRILNKLFIACLFKHGVYKLFRRCSYCEVCFPVPKYVMATAWHMPAFLILLFKNTVRRSISFWQLMTVYVIYLFIMNRFAVLSWGHLCVPVSGAIESSWYQWKLVSLDAFLSIRSCQNLFGRNVTDIIHVWVAE